MFSFFHKSSVINVDCFTSNVNAYKFAPIVRSSKAKPSWYESVMKTQPSNTKWPEYKTDPQGNISFNWHPSHRTVKSCPGFHDLYSKGFILESWCDLVFNVTENNFSYHYSNGEAPMLHSQAQIQPGFMDHHIVKLKSPWYIHTKENVQFVLIGAEWSHEDYDFGIMPGVLDFQYQTSSNVFITIRKNKVQQFNIPMGMPLAQFVPLSDKRVKINNHIVTEEELKTKMYNVTGTSFGWRKTKSLVKRNIERQKKCPFGFGD